MTKRIAIVGPESSGKSTLAASLAGALHCAWVPEFARAWFAAQNSTSYSLADVVAIARGQDALEQQLAESSPHWLVCDTTALVCKIWAEVRFGHCPESLVWRPQRYAFHLLMQPDLAWQPDPLREHPHGRDALYARYRQALIEAGAPFAEIGGHERLQSALNALGRHTA
ncbi:AAA family ATPase [Chitinibacteraceae bacterium HSL-7]